MNIVFICGSLETGRDGVGDYTRRLAGELLRCNHQVAIIALHDRQLGERMLKSTQAEAGQNVPTLRLSSQLTWTARIILANEFIEAIDPDWISLQYVPFSFHKKGLPFRLTSMLKQLIAKRPLHLMFHELWLGMSTQSPERHIWWGLVQRYQIWLMLTSLKAKVVHTNNLLYLSQLEKIGIQATLLPLFSNIPIVNAADTEAQEKRVDIKNRIGLVFFGAIFPGAPVSELADEVALYADKKKVEIDLTIIGRSGPEQETWSKVWRSRGITVHLLGEQPPAYISKILSQSSIGLSTTPVELTGKSGSIAAMQAHKLPVMCVSQQARSLNLIKANPGILEYTIGNFEHLMNSRTGINLPSVDVNDITQVLLDDLLLKNCRIQSSASHLP